MAHTRVVLQSTLLVSRLQLALCGRWGNLFQSTRLVSDEFRSHHRGLLSYPKEVVKLGILHHCVGLGEDE